MIARWFHLLVMVVVGLVGCRRPPPSRAPNLVLIVLDTVRMDHLSVYGYPRPTSPVLERFSSQGATFLRAYSTSSWTLPAHASMFSGLLPEQHRATQSHLHIDPNIPLLADQLAAAGYETAAFSNNPWVSPKTGLAQGFSTFVSLWGSPGERRWYLPGHPTVRQVRRWLRSQWTREHPFFLFVNLMEAHGPYQPSWEHAAPIFGDRAAYDEALEIYGDVGEQGLVRRHYLASPPLEPELVAAAMDLYDGELHTVDAVAGEILALVDEASEPASTTVLIVSDHGEHFGEHGQMGHAFSVYEPLLRVAMLARGPGFETQTTRDDLVQLTDIHATLMAAAGLVSDGCALQRPCPERVGLSASYDYPLQVLRTFPAELRESAELDVVRRSFGVGLTPQYKLIRDSNGGEAFYDILMDPEERHPLGDLDPETREMLRRLAGEPSVSRRWRKEPEPAWDQESHDALEALGYLE